MQTIVAHLVRPKQRSETPNPTVFVDIRRQIVAEADLEPVDLEALFRDLKRYRFPGESRIDTIYLGCRAIDMAALRKMQSPKLEPKEDVPVDGAILFTIGPTEDFILVPAALGDRGDGIYATMLGAVLYNSMMAEQLGYGQDFVFIEPGEGWQKKLLEEVSGYFLPIG